MYSNARCRHIYLMNVYVALSKSVPVIKVCCMHARSIVHWIHPESHSPAAGLSPWTSARTRTRNHLRATRSRLAYTYVRSSFRAYIRTYVSVAVAICIICKQIPLHNALRFEASHLSYIAQYFFQSSTECTIDEQLAAIWRRKVCIFTENTEDFVNLGTQANYM